MSEPKDGAHTRRSRLVALVEYIMEHTGEGVSTQAVRSDALIHAGLRPNTVDQYLKELRDAAVIRFEKDGWHTTAKAREFFK